jgi:hypothetical protein
MVLHELLSQICSPTTGMALAIFGISFGSKKTSGSTKSTLTKDETTEQAQTSLKDSASTSTESGSTSSTSAGTSSTTQAGTTSSNKDSLTNAVSQLFSGGVLTGLESTVTDLLGASDQSGNVVDTAIQKLNGFDAAGYVDSSVKAATSTQQQNLDQIFGSLQDNIGSGIENNSMAMLLANRANNDSASAIEGVRANATATAEQIQRENQMGAVGAAGSQNQFLGQLLDALKGGQATQTQTGTESGTGTTGTSGTTNTAESSSQQTQTQATTQLVEALAQLLSGTTHSVGTENTKTTGKTKGGGLSLSL